MSTLRLVDRRDCPHPWRDRAAATAGLALATLAVAAWLTLVEVFWLPLRVGAVPVPVSVLAAVVGNLMLPGLAYRLSGSRLVAAVPAAVWVVISVAASMRRPEGDLVLVGGGTAGAVNLAYLLLGVVTAAFATGRVVTGPSRSGAVRSTGRPVGRPESP